ncbi:MAG: NAD(P)-dependent oxidoreductase [Thermoplasmata archaeon]
MKVSIIEPLGVSDEILDRLSNEIKKKGVEIVRYGAIKESPALEDRIKDADIVILANTKFDLNAIHAAKRLKMISVAFTGVDHIDLAYCRERKIIVSNAAGYSTHSVAEHTFGLVFAVVRKIVDGDKASRNSGSRVIGHELFGKTFGIIGTGRIGCEVAKIANAFGCKVIAYSRTRRKEIESIVEYVSLERLLRESDIVSLHVPLNDETRNLIDGKKIELMKKDAILINTSRGLVIDSKSVANALREGRLAGLGADVLEMEPPYPKEHPLLNCPNTVITPHVAYATHEALEMRAKIAFENVIKYLEGNPQNIVV